MKEVYWIEMKRERERQSETSLGEGELLIERENRVEERFKYKTQQESKRER